MRTTKQCSMTTLQWATLFRHIDFNSNLFVSTFNELKVFQFIRHRTIPYHKLDELITYEVFEHGSITSNMLVGTNISKSNLSRTKNKLKEKGIIFTTDGIVKGSRRIIYRLNLIGILEAIIVIRKNHIKQPKVFVQQTARLSEILKILKPFYKKLNTSIRVKLGGKSMVLADVEKHARLQAVEHKTKKRIKRKEQPMRCSWIKDFFQECCDYSGRVAFSEAPWTQKDWGTMKNFLKECKANALDPRAYIKKACELWPKFQYKIISDQGKAVHLKPEVNVRQFYIYRGQIIDWINSLQKTKVIPMDNSNGDGSIDYYSRCPKTQKRFKISKKDYDSLDGEKVTRQDLADKYLYGNLHGKK